MRKLYIILDLLLLGIVLSFKSSGTIPRSSIEHTLPNIDLIKITGADKGYVFHYRDWSFWQQKSKGIKSYEERRKMLSNPDYILSYIVFWVDDIYRLRKSYDAGTISLALSQSYKESALGLSALGLKGNHHGIKGKFDLNKNQIQRAKDDHKWKSTFGVAQYYGYAGYVQYFRTISNKRFDTPDRVKGDRNDYKVWSKALQNPFKYHKACGGLGCEDCGGLGLKGCTVYATMKEKPNEKANPDAYRIQINSIISQFGWDVFDKLNEQQINVWQEYVKRNYTHNGK